MTCDGRELLKRARQSTVDTAMSTARGRRSWRDSVKSGRAGHGARSWEPEPAGAGAGSRGQGAGSTEAEPEPEPEPETEPEPEMVSSSSHSLNIAEGSPQ